MKTTNTPFWLGWETVRLIGHGNYGVVYEIERTIGKTTEKSALKVITIPKERSEIRELSLKGYDRESITERFRGLKESIEEEYATMAKLKGCANVVYCDDIRTIQHADGIGWDIYIRMELLTPLLEYKKGAMEEGEIIRLGKELCNALMMCQQSDNIVHRDIKPQNIFVSNDGTFKLGDFGIAKAVEHTTSGTMAGTYDYMAPEVEKHLPYNRTVDIYSLGMVLYWYLNEKRLPFLPLPPAIIKHTDEPAAKEKRMRGVPLPAPAHGSEKLKQIVLKACAYNPKARFQSAEEMLRALAALSGESVNPSFTPKRSEAKELRKNRVAEIALGEEKRLTDKGTQGTFGIISVEQKSETKRSADKTIRVFNNPSPKLQSKPNPKPKKRLIVFASLLAALVAIAACVFLLPGWTPATCDTPETHKIFGITRGESLGHKWEAASCEEPTVCAVCGVESDALRGHDWGAANYTWSWDNSSVVASRRCTLCNYTETETVQSTSQITEAATCVDNGKTTYTAKFQNSAFSNQLKTVENIPALGHTWAEATYSSPEICIYCGAARGTPLKEVIIPSEEYLDGLNFSNQFVYPGSGHYYSTAVEKQIENSNGNGVFVWAYLRKAADNTRIDTLMPGTEVLAIAEQEGLACIVYANSSGETRVGWINPDYLADKVSRFFFDRGASIVIPDAFSDFGVERTEDQSAFRFIDHSQGMELKLKEIDTTNYSVRDTEYLNNLYISTKENRSPTYDSIRSDRFDLSGYDNDNIYYYEGVLSGHVIFIIEMHYPTKNRGICDRYVEIITESFTA